MAYFDPGTRYSNSATYDVATAEVNKFGDTIFEQRRPDDVPTGRRSVVIGGQLVSETIAEAIHRSQAEARALELRDALRRMLVQYAGIENVPTGAIDNARALLAELA